MSVKPYGPASGEPLRELFRKAQPFDAERWSRFCSYRQEFDYWRKGHPNATTEEVKEAMWRVRDKWVSA